MLQPWEWQRWRTATRLYWVIVLLPVDRGGTVLRGIKHPHRCPENSLFERTPISRFLLASGQVVQAGRTPGFQGEPGRQKPWGKSQSVPVYLASGEEFARVRKFLLHCSPNYPDRTPSVKQKKNGCPTGRRAAASCTPLADEMGIRPASRHTGTLILLCPAGASRPCLP